MNDRNIEEMHIVYGEQIIEIWDEIMAENKDVFETDAEKIFLAMEIALRCHDLGTRLGLLELEEYIWEMNHDEVPFWEYFKPASWILINLALGDEDKVWMLVSLFVSYKYTGYQAAQGCIYLIDMASLASQWVSAGKMLGFFRTLVPKEKQAAFDNYFQQMSKQWEAQTTKR